MPLVPVPIHPGDVVPATVTACFGSAYATVVIASADGPRECAVSLATVIPDPEYAHLWRQEVSDSVHAGDRIAVRWTGASDDELPLVDILDQDARPIGLHAVELGWAVPNEAAFTSSSADRMKYVMSLKQARAANAGMWGDGARSAQQWLSHDLLRDSQPEVSSLWRSSGATVFVVAIVVALIAVRLLRQRGARLQPRQWLRSPVRTLVQWHSLLIPRPGMFVAKEAPQPTADAPPATANPQAPTAARAGGAALAVALALASPGLTAVEQQTQVREREGAIASVYGDERRDTLSTAPAMPMPPGTATLRLAGDYRTVMRQSDPDDQRVLGDRRSLDLLWRQAWWSWFGTELSLGGIDSPERDSLALSDLDLQLVFTPFRRRYRALSLSLGAGWGLMNAADLDAGHGESFGIPGGSASLRYVDAVGMVVFEHNLRLTYWPKAHADLQHPRLDAHGNEIPEGDWQYEYWQGDAAIAVSYRCARWIRFGLEPSFRYQYWHGNQHRDKAVMYDRTLDVRAFTEVSAGSFAHLMIGGGPDVLALDDHPTRAWSAAAAVALVF